MIRQNPNSRIPNSKQRLWQIIKVVSKYKLHEGITPGKVRQLCEELGPTFVKFGQIMSMRRDMLPAEVCEELTHLRTDVTPMPFSQVLEVMESEYGHSAWDSFSSIEAEPLGSASIAQVHVATLKSDSSKVVIKVQRPNIYNIMAQDIALLKRAGRIVKRASKRLFGALDFDVILNEMWFAAQQEMDFLIEARNMAEFWENNSGVAYCRCPKIYPDYTTARVLVMEYIEGISIDDTNQLLQNGYELNEIGSKLAASYVKQVIDDAFFQADPHPGNLRIAEGKIIWLDLGMMGRITSRDRALLKEGVKAIAGGDTATLKEILLTMGVVSGPVDHARLYSDVDSLLGKYADADIGSLDLGQAMGDLLTLANSHHISMPKGITMLSRGLLTIEGVIEKLSPDISILEVMSQRVPDELFDPEQLPKQLRLDAASLYASGRKALSLPSQLSDVLHMAKRGQTKVNLEVVGSSEPLRAIGDMVNRLIVGIISAALLVGSSLICTTDMHPQILGIPALGIVGFLAAASLCIWLLIDIRLRRR